MRAIAVLLGLLWASVAGAEVGAACPESGQCAPPEFCFPDDGPGYCTARCQPGDGACPEGMSCRQTEDVADIWLCIRGGADGPNVDGVGLGEPCDAVAYCAEGLFCAQDVDRAYCTRQCTVAGSCPAGFACVGANDPACSPLAGAPGFGEPCGAEQACAEGLACTPVAGRTQPLCTRACGRACPDGWACEGDLCVPPPAALPGFGERCVAEGAEAAVVGCAAGHTCKVERPEPYCTRPCDGPRTCPEGYGCALRDGERVCRRGYPDDDEGNPPPVDLPDGGFPVQDALPPPTGDAAVPGGGGGGGSEESGGGGGGGCSAVPGRGAGAGALGALALLLGVARRRRR